MIIYIVVLLTILAMYFCRNIRRKGSRAAEFKEIPIEKGLPIIGVVKNIKENMFKYLFKLGQKHGPIYQIQFGMRNVVVLNSLEYLRAAFVEQGDAFAGRWKAQKYVFVANNAGLFFIDGNVWAEQRYFVLNTLKKFGIGSSRSVEIVQSECQYMLEELEQTTKQKINLIDFMSVYSFNVTSKFVMNKRYSRDDPEIEANMKFVRVVVNENDPLANILLMFPFLDNHEWLVKFLLWIVSRKSLGNNFDRLIEREIKEHSARLDSNSEREDLIDRFLVKQRREREEKGTVGTFTQWQLVKTAFDLLMAGIDSVSLTLGWSFMFMTMYPDIQTKVHEEIIDKIGNERMPTMADKVSLVYTQAVIDEISRLASIAPLSAMHRVTKDVNMKGYFIPAETITFMNIFACHHDPKVWEKPFEFYPEHFLVKGSKGEPKYRPREELIPFGIGQRQCLGESLARINIFIFFVSIVQKFQVNMVKETDFDVFGGSDGILRKPDVEEFLFVKRQ